MALNGILGRMDMETAQLRARMQTLTRQVSTGQKAEATGDLAPQLPRAVTLRAEAARRDAYGTAISQALGRTEAAQATLTRLQEIARKFADDTALKLSPDDKGSIGFAASSAKQALVEVGQLLNAQYGGEYLFGGSDFGNPPVPNADKLDQSAFAIQIAATVGALGVGNAASVAAGTLTIAQDNTAGTTPFSAFVSGTAGLAEARRGVPTADGEVMAYGLFANRNAAAVSTGQTTGSWARDLLRGLASMAALTDSQATTAPSDFRAFAQTIRDGLKSASDALADEAGALGLTEERLKAVQTRHATLHDTLTAQLSDIEEVDLAATLSRLQSTRTTLEASYQALGQLGQLTLARYLR